MKKFGMIMSVFVVFAVCSTTVQAGIILQDQVNTTWQILHHSPAGQTFTAEDQYIQSIGFWLKDFNPDYGPIDFTIELFQGEGIGGMSLGSAPIEGLYPGYNSFFDANFDFVQLEVGQIYTAIVSSPTPRGGVRGFYWSHPDLSDPYTGGDAILFGQIYGHADMAFRVIPAPEPACETAVDIKPETLNTKSQGRWITCKIKAPDGYTVADIVKDSIKLAGIVPAQHVQANPGQQQLTMKFDRLVVIDTLILQEGLDRNGGFNIFANVKVTGQLTDGKTFEGTDKIRFLHNVRTP